MPDSPPRLSDFPLLDSLRLLRTEGIGPLTFYRLMERYGSPAAALRCWSQIGGKQGIAESPLGAGPVEQEMAATEALGARFLPLGDPAYPELLAQTPDAPPVLVLHGDASLLRKPAIAIVGSRNASAHARKFAQKLAEDIAAAGYTVVSGLARGIDASAHQGALSGGTIGVIATGIDQCYPPEHQALDAEIRQSGIILTEQPFGTTPYPRAFPRRNRIVAGMTKATIVVEAGLQSGSLITARMAADYGRDVFAVPGHPLDVRATGCNRLIKEGAGLLEGVEDILELYGRPEQPPLPLFAVNTVPEAPETLERELLSHLTFQGIEIDELSALCHTGTNELLTLLLELELAGRVVKLPGGRIAKAA